MCWSHSIKGPALEVARAVEIEAEGPQKYLEEKEKSLHARAVAMIVVACHAQPKDGWVYVNAFGHGGPNEQNVSVSITAVAPDKAPEPVVEPEVEKPESEKPSAEPEDPVKPAKRAKLK